MIWATVTSRRSSRRQLRIVAGKTATTADRKTVASADDGTADRAADRRFAKATNSALFAAIETNGAALSLLAQCLP
jgi:hypothetical protein